MNAFFTVIGMHVLILGIFYVFYRLILSRDTFFQLNRWVLLAGIAASVLLPFFRPTYMVNIESSEAIVNVAPLVLTTAEVAPQSEVVQTNRIEWLVLSIYMLVVLVLLFRWSRRLYAVLVEAGRRNRVVLNGTQVVNTSKYPSPFSFFHLIFINLQNYKEDERLKIVAHEKAHVEQRHWIDLLLIQLLGIIAWLNPLASWYEKAIKENHEYLADAAVLKKGIDRRQYQSLILRHMLGSPPVAIANHLFNHHSKNRFQMMNQHRSKTINQFKIFGILPLLALTLWAFAQPAYNTVSTSPIKNETISSSPGKASVFESEKSADEIIVKGRVTYAKTGAPVVAANIIIANTTLGTVSDRDGSFAIKVKPGASLVVTYVGYQSVEIQVKDGNFLKIPLAPKYTKIKLTTPSKKQEQPTVPSKNEIEGEIFEIVESMPYYRDTDNKILFETIEKKVKKFTARSGEKGSVTVHFIVNSHGQVIDAYAHESTNPKLDKVAVDIVSELKDWKPGKQRGKAIDTRLKLSLDFK